MQTRPSATTILAVLLWVAGAVNVIGALQEFGHLPLLLSSGGTLFVADQIDGWLQAAVAIASLFLAGGLWADHDWARRAVLVVAALNIVVVLFTKVEGGQSWLNAIPGLLVNGAILFYARTTNGRAALVA